MVMLRSNFSDFYLEDALPALDYIVDMAYKAYDPFFEKVFNVKSMSGSITQTAQLSELTPAPEVGEGEEYPQTKVVQGFAQTYISLKYGLILAHSEELMEDSDQWDVMGKNAQKLSRAFMVTCDTLAAAIFNSGFVTNGLDGVPLFSASHPLLAPGAGTASNLLGTPADMSATSIKSLLTLLNKTVDTAGNPIKIMGKKLICSLDDEHLAHEILDSEFLVDSSNASVNATNVIKNMYGLEVVASPFLTDPDAHFVSGDKADHFLMWFWRKQPATNSDIEFKTGTLLQKISGRFAVGYSDWRGIVGTPGT